MNTYSMFDKWMAGICRKNEWILKMFDKWMVGINRKKGWILNT